MVLTGSATMAPGTFSPVNAPVTQRGGYNRVSQPVTSPGRFFRLELPSDEAAR